MIVLGCWKTGTERIMETSDPAVGCLSIGWMFGWCGMSDVAVGRLDDEESCQDGWLSFAWIDVVLFGSSFLLLWGSIMVVLSSQHLRCEMSGQFVLHHYYGSDEHERENVLHNDCWVLDEDREEMFFSVGVSIRNTTCWFSLRRVLPCSAVSSFDSFRSSCPPLNLGSLSFDAPCVNLGFRLVRVCSSVQQNRVHRRVECRFLPPSVIGDVGPYCGPSGVAATVRVDARFQGTIVRGLGYPSCRPSPCGPRRQFDIGDSCVRSKKQLQLFGSCIYIFI